MSAELRSLYTRLSAIKPKRVSFLSTLGVIVLLLALVFPVAAGGRPFSTSLTGAEEVPAPGDLDGSGTASLTLNEGQGEVCFEISVSNITLPASGAHIHEAPAGVAGGIVVFLTAPDASGFSSGCATGVNRDLIKAIRQNPAGYYVNVHNSDFPGGAVRGQLSK